MFAVDSSSGFKDGKCAKLFGVFFCFCLIEMCCDFHFHEGDLNGVLHSIFAFVLKLLVEVICDGIDGIVREVWNCVWYV